MIRINQIKMPLHHDAAALEQKIRKRLGLSGGQELRYRIIRKSIDARKKPELRWCIPWRFPLPEKRKS